MLNRGIAHIQTNSTNRKGKLHFFGIGINDYQNWSKLKNAVNDVEAIADVLHEKYFFEDENIVIFKNEEATRKKIVNKLHNYTEGGMLSSDDSLIICFSGHGHLDTNGDGYWVPVESAEQDIDSYIPNETIQRNIKRMKCLHVLLISDSCFSGSLISKRGLPSVQQLVAEELSKKKSRFVFTSGGYNESVLDGFDEHSPFANAILSELRHNTKPLLISDELALKVRDITHNNALIQMPEFMPFVESGDMAGRFVFRLKDGVVSSTFVTPPNPLPNPPQKPWWVKAILKFGLLKIAIILFAIISAVIATNLFIENKRKNEELTIAEKKKKDEDESNRVVIEKEKEDWGNAQKLDTKQGYEAYLNKYSQGTYKQYAQIAKDSIDKHTNPKYPQSNDAQKKAMAEKARLAENERRKNAIIAQKKKEIKDLLINANAHLQGGDFQSASNNISEVLKKDSLSYIVRQTLIDARAFIAGNDSESARQKIQSILSNF